MDNPETARPHSSGEYQRTGSGIKRTPSGIKRALRGIGYTQRQAARETRQSTGLVSMVLRGLTKSRPCLDKLHDLIAQVRAERRAEKERRDAA